MSWKAKPDPETCRSTRGKALRNKRKPRRKIPARPPLSSPQPEKQGLPEETACTAAVWEPAAEAEAAVARESVSTTAQPVKKRGQRFWLVQACILLSLAVLGLLLYQSKKNATLTVTYSVPGAMTRPRNTFTAKLQPCANRSRLTGRPSSVGRTRTAGRKSAKSFRYIPTGR